MLTDATVSPCDISEDNAVPAVIRIDNVDEVQCRLVITRHSYDIRQHTSAHERERERERERESAREREREYVYMFVCMFVCVCVCVCRP